MYKQHSSVPYCTNSKTYSKSYRWQRGAGGGRREQTMNAPPPKAHYFTRQTGHYLYEMTHSSRLLATLVKTQKCVITGVRKAQAQRLRYSASSAIRSKKWKNGSQMIRIMTQISTLERECNFRTDHDLDHVGIITFWWKTHPQPPSQFVAAQYSTRDRRSGDSMLLCTHVSACFFSDSFLSTWTPGNLWVKV